MKKKNKKKSVNYQFKDYMKPNSILFTIYLIHSSVLF